MVKSAMVVGSGQALAALAMAGTAAGFLPMRREVISLLPMSAVPAAGYVWRRVFLKTLPPRRRGGFRG